MLRSAGRLCLIFILGGLALASLNSASLGTAAQPIPGTGIVYVTRAENAPNGAILKPLDIAFAAFTPIVTGLSSPDSIRCGPDGRLYVLDLFAPQGRSSVNRIVRYNQDGSGRAVVAEWNSQELRPGAMAFAPNGDLYFGTVSIAAGQPTKGVWRIPGVQQADQQFNPPEQVLSPTVFQNPTEKATYGAESPTFLTAGPFQGDLLIVDRPNAAGLRGGRVLRAPNPTFTSVVEFIAARVDVDMKQPVLPSGMATNSKGEVFITDFTNGKVLRFGPDGTAKGVFADKIPYTNQIAIGPDDLVYVTNVAFREGMPLQGGLFIFDPEGKLLGAVNYKLSLRGVTVCGQS